MDRYVPPSRSDDRPAMYRFGEDRNSRPSGGDSYRPGEFSFRAQDNSAPRFPRERHAPPPQQHYQRRGRALPQGSSYDRNRDPRRKPYQPKPRWRPPPTSERPLLCAEREATPEQLKDMVEAEARFRAVEDLSDSQESDMELDSDSQPCDGASSDDERPVQKRVKTSAAVNSDVASEAPKWSNPDPYTALPPVHDAAAKRKDFVGLIRKAKTLSGKENAAAGVSTDFISFGFDDVPDEAEPASESDDSELEIIATREVVKDAKSKKFSHLDNLHPDRTAPGVSSASASVDMLGPPPSMPPGLLPNFPGASRSLDVWPPPPPLPPTNDNPMSRKRTRDELDDEVTNLQQDFAGGKKKGGKINGDIIQEWRAKRKDTSTPWCTVDHSVTENLGHRLHKEIIDFYEFVKPQHFENEVRHDLVHRVGNFLRRRYPNCEIRFFGSFAAGLYLPNADMDLVVLSKSFIATGRPFAGQQKADLRAFANHLTKDRLSKDRAIPIVAKVPIVKYVDAQTDLRVDISFDNDTGLVANNTYNEWKAQYPAMPYIVTLVKQFLAMRGLNEVFSGGLGGFSITCMVVSLMQCMPQLQSKNMDPMHNLGEIFMAFLDFYGNKLNTESTGIQMTPPYLFSKVCASSSAFFQKSDLLTSDSVRKGVSPTTQPSRGLCPSLILIESRMISPSDHTTSRRCYDASPRHTPLFKRR